MFYKEQCLCVTTTSSQTSALCFMILHMKVCAMLHVQGWSHSFGCPIYFFMLSHMCSY